MRQRTESRRQRQTSTTPQLFRPPWTTCSPSFTTPARRTSLAKAVASGPTVVADRMRIASLGLRPRAVLPGHDGVKILLSYITVATNESETKLTDDTTLQEQLPRSIFQATSSGGTGPGTDACKDAKDTGMLVGAGAGALGGGRLGAQIGAPAGVLGAAVGAAAGALLGGIIGAVGGRHIGGRTGACKSAT